MKIPLICAMLAGAALAAEGPNTPLEDGFKNPPNSARAGMMWQWMGGNVSTEAITADLEAMSQAGITDVIVFSDVALGCPQGSVAFMTEDWEKMIGWAATEADRLGIGLRFHNSPGWATSGGPWIAPQDSMQMVVESETYVQGPASVNMRLPQPPTAHGYYEDIAVLAIPVSGPDGSSLLGANHRITSNFPATLDALNDESLDTAVSVKYGEGADQSQIDFEFEKPYPVRSFWMIAKPAGGSGTIELQSSSDGFEFRTVACIAAPGVPVSQWFGSSFSPVTAKYYRLILMGNGIIDVGAVELSASARIADWLPKTGATLAPIVPGGSAHLAEAEVISASAILDVTSLLHPDGTLKWEAPPGNWLLLRMGHTTTGATNKPATPIATGLEADKLSGEASQKHWNGMAAKIIDIAGGPGGGVKGIHFDSVECYMQNWTPKMCEEFKNRRGYDLWPYLPAITGRIVNGVDQSERFLWDFRRTIAELWAEKSWGEFRKLANNAGVTISAEPYGRAAFNAVNAAEFIDLPLGEFWATDNRWALTAKAVVSAAQISGARVIGAEAFTATAQGSRWDVHPYSLKAQGDKMFTTGMNRFYLHSYPMQPWSNRFPGVTLASYGTQFTRHQTWWEPARAWFDYLARCQYLLQQGTPVIDLLVIAGEDSPVSGSPASSIIPGDPGNPTPAFIPQGYDFTICSAEKLIRDMRMQNGKATLPGGFYYSVIVLPESEAMTPELLRKLHGMVEEGAVIVGNKPSVSPSLVNFPQCDLEIQKLANDLWGAHENAADEPRHFGKGMVYDKTPIAKVLDDLGVPPDMEIVPMRTDAEVRYVHRTNGDEDIYFLASGSPESRKIRCAFRVTGKTPELWHPDTGKTEDAPVFSIDGGRTTVDLDFDPYGSVFVVFRKAAQQPRSHKTRGKRVEIAALEGPWDISFPPGLGAPPNKKLDKLISWTDSPDVGIKYFSGSATYRSTFRLSEDMAQPTPLILDLGKIGVIAEVYVNETKLGTLWKPPFQIDISQAAKQGDNSIAIKVTNVWANRLIGDELISTDLNYHPQGFLQKWPTWINSGQPAPGGRIGFSTWRHLSKDDPLVPSGLMGPVRIFSFDS